MKQSSSNLWIARSVALYRALLVLYPAAYRRDYGALMVQLFRDVAREKYAGGGILAMALWWCKTLVDLLVTAVEQRRKEGNLVKANIRTNLENIAGLNLIGGGMLWAVSAFSNFQAPWLLSYSSIYGAAVAMLVPAYLWVGVGCVGLALRRQSSLGKLQRGLLYATSVTALLASVLLFIWVSSQPISVTMVNGQTQTNWDGDQSIRLWYTFVLHAAALLGFGIMHFRRPILPIARWLPLLLGVVRVVAHFPLPIGPDAPISLSTYQAFSFVVSIITGILWLLIGWSIHHHRRDAMLPAT